MNTFVKYFALTVKPVSSVRNVSTGCLRYKDDFNNLIHPDGHEPSIPQYIEREKENTDVKRARLVYQSRKRGAKPTPPEFDNEIMDLLKRHIRNDDRQARIMQPEL
ncbi:succinate dehydrogenase assembly factor 2, mitochondrial isoform X2 [Megachile rotundata]|uniref:succinate dehydrogenase assembly factor 2, mitochondrial isoform X2 n=1 Tax=Megachile rotundata TaxID=143995 RepID=UPI00061505E8|nr:PREDICTED: succinate dehydrogenase assembly factor 2, mitochondrial-like isoform X2 [Megachile rotundata]